MQNMSREQASLLPYHSCMHADRVSGLHLFCFEWAYMGVWARNLFSLSLSLSLVAQSNNHHPTLILSRSQVRNNGIMSFLQPIWGF